MNFKYHLIAGGALDITMGTFPISTISSVIPDFPLIKNEINLIRNKEKFDATKINEFTLDLYFTTHSIFMVIALFLITKTFWLGYLIHIICDLFTHTGIFTARPFYPFTWRFPWGRNILK